jgi:hypothetical protein
MDKLKIEIYKELGAYERHFNQIQNVFKGLASTWFFGGFAAIGFLYSSKLVESFPTKLELASSLVALTVATGIVLFWMMDVMVYHKLLRAVVKKSELLEKSESFLPDLRKTMVEYTTVLNVRRATSIFYITPSLIMTITSFIFINKSWNQNDWTLNILLGCWLVTLTTGNILILIFQKRKKNYVA